MPDLIRVDGLNDSEQRHLDALLKQWRQKRPRNNLRSGFYDMKNSTRALMGSTVPAVVKNRAFVLGWAAASVDKLNRRCNLEGFYDAGGVDLDSMGLGEVIRTNRLLSEVSQAGVSSLIHAVSWLVTTQGDEDAGEPPVLVTAKAATSATGMWDVRRREMSSFLSIAAMDDGGEPTSMAMYLPDLILIMAKSDGSWSLERREHNYGVPVDPMRYKPRIGRPFGSSRITRSVMSIHMQALAAMMRADVNGEAYSLARYVLLGATEEAFKNADGTQKPTWQAAWDAVWAIGDDKGAPPGLERADIKQFQGQSPEPQNAHLRMLAQMFSGETGIPLGELGIIGDSNPASYEAMMASRDDLIAEAESTTDAWDPDVSSAAKRALEMLGNDVSRLDIRARWRPPMHTSRAAAADAGAKILDKMPWLADTEVGMELVGLTPEQIRRATADRRVARGASTVSALAAAAAAARTLTT